MKKINLNAEKAKTNEQNKKGYTQDEVPFADGKNTKLDQEIDKNNNGKNQDKSQH
ncbi:hypothetical protein [Pedobacter jamesrossensis]|uniref:hypothetical protein n=1 Tax=Pedobacter jamesrossensis TaxID=1908238 RepID=UPI00361251C8